MTPAASLPECAAQLNRALAMRDFSGAQTWLIEYRRQFDQEIESLPPDEARQLLTAAMEGMESAQYAALAARSHIAAKLADITRAAAYRKTVAHSHAWELQG